MTGIDKVNAQVMTSGGIGAILQVSHLVSIKSSYESKTPFVIKNISDNKISANIRPAGQEKYIRTQIFPGWNPELATGIGLGSMDDTGMEISTQGIGTLGGSDIQIGW